MVPYRIFLVTLFFIFVFLTACTAESGQLRIQANGEDFVRRGFVSKDGWSITFDNVFVTLDNVTAYQTDPPYQSISNTQPKGESVSIDAAQTVDLAAGDENAGPILVQTLESKVGQYNAISWEMVQGKSEATVQLIGTAVKDITIPFNILIEDSYSYVCGEYVGDERKGFVTQESPGEIEMTFHFDHIFGDANTADTASLNTGALGFDPLATLATNNTLEVTQSELAQLLPDDQYKNLLANLATLGHVGEGHCFEALNGYTAHEQE